MMMIRHERAAAIAACAWNLRESRGRRRVTANPFNVRVLMADLHSHQIERMFDAYCDHIEAEPLFSLYRTAEVDAARTFYLSEICS